MSELLVALAGNPNSGKTTVFNRLTGARRHVANYPGVTVEAKEGRFVLPSDEPVRLLDLPGTYSLSAYSPEELVARRAILERRPDAVVCVVDATNLERNLYLVTQFAELGVPVVVGLNMMDEIESLGRRVDAQRLSRLLGMPVAPLVARTGKGLSELIEAAVEAARQGRTPSPFPLGQHVEEAVAEIDPALDASTAIPESRRRYFALKLLEGDAKVEEEMGVDLSPEHRALIERTASGLASHLGEPVEVLVADDRYGVAAGIAREVVTPSSTIRAEVSERIDAILTHRLLGLPLLGLILWGLFEGVFRLGAPPMEWIEAGFAALSAWLSDALPEGPLQSVIVDGCIGGVGGVLVFVPQILLLFLGIALLEDTGYLARAAFVIDRVMHLIGLHGKSFIPMLIGFGCSVPAVLATRTLADRKDRLTTMLVTPFISCSARLPVYVLLIGAFFPAESSGAILVSIYALGVVVACVMARVLKSTIFRGESESFVMELPPYRLPTARALLVHMWERVWQYVRKAGTVILAMSVIVWALCSFPAAPAGSDEPDLAYSAAGRAGRALEPAMRPLGFDWRMTVALLTGVSAKEVVVSSLATIYGVGDEEDEATMRSLRERLRSDAGMTPLSAYAFMVFVLLYVPCLVTVTVVAREAGSWRWGAFLTLYTIATAWVVAFLVYRGGLLLGFS